MGLILFILFTIVPILELVVILKVGEEIGAFNTIGLLIGIGALGAYLAKLQGIHVLGQIQENLNRGVMPTTELMDGFLILGGGVLLITPGFLSDCLGIFLLLPPTRHVIKMGLRWYFEGRIKKTQTKRSPDGYIDIDVTPKK